MVPEAPPTADSADASKPVPPPTDEPVPSPTGETAEETEPEAFGEGPVKLSLLPLYPNHTVRHIWDRELELVGLIYFKLCLF